MTTSTTRTLETAWWHADSSRDLWDVSVGELLSRTATRWPDRTALVYGSPVPSERQRWTYRELMADVVARAHWLAGLFSPGERVAVCGPNGPEWPLLQYALSLAGLVMVPVNPAYRPRELEHVLADSASVGVVHVDTDHGTDVGGVIATLRPRLPALREVVPWSDVVDRSRSSAQRPLPKVVGSDLVQVQYTSGTTGFPKGALLCHRAVINSARFVAEAGGLPEGGVWINPMPIFHLGSNVTAALGTLARGGTHVLVPRFAAALISELIEGERGNVSLLVPTMILDLLNDPATTTRDLSSLCGILTGATTVPAPLVERTRRELGCDVTVLYGQTEVSGNLTRTHRHDDARLQAETVGQPLPGVEVRVVDTATGATQAVGVVGELRVRGYQAMVGYLGAPEQTAETLDADGWLATGDLATMDEHGYIRIVGRTKDVVVRGGLNIYPREIEDVLYEHREVGQASVVADLDDRLGEVPVAAVIPRRRGAGAGLDTEFEDLAARLDEHCRERLAPYKVPVRWFVVTAFPLTPTQKVQKNVLREWIATGRIRATAEDGRPRTPRLSEPSR